MVPLQIPGGPELLILVLIVLLPVAILYVLYKLFQGAQEFRRGMRET